GTINSTDIDGACGRGVGDGHIVGLDDLDIACRGRQVEHIGRRIDGGKAVDIPVCRERYGGAADNARAPRTKYGPGRSDDIDRRTALYAPVDRDIARRPGERNRANGARDFRVRRNARGYDGPVPVETGPGNSDIAGARARDLAVAQGNAIAVGAGP